MPKQNLNHVKAKWRILKTTSGFKNTMLFLVFVCVSAIFWFILALNDSAQNHFSVTLRINNKPDSVTFISDVPEKIHVAVSDKGTNLWRNGYLKHPVINVDFKEYSADGVLHYSYNDLITSLREYFGNNATITNVSLDSLQLFYTTNPGKRVPVLVKCDVQPAPGSTLEGAVSASPGSVLVYGSKETLDTVRYVTTQPLTLRDLSETTAMEVKLQKIRNARIVPDKTVLTIPIEALVRKNDMVTVDAINVPKGKEMLLFPSKIPVEYYVAMSKINDDEDNNIKLIVDYNDIFTNKNGKLKVQIHHFPDRLKNMRLNTDSIEYAVIKD